MTELAPVEVLLERDHAYRKKGEGRRGCADCNRGKLAPVHLGAPPSMNAGGSGMNRMAYQSLKVAWQAAITLGLDAAGLPRGLEAVSVEALIGFPSYVERDEGNVRWMLEKALGDALVAGGWLPSDSFWPTRRFTLHNLEGTHVRGRSFTRLLFFPSMAAGVEPREGQAVLL